MGSGSDSRAQARKLVARVHERLANARQDFLHKLSRKLVDDNQVIVVENLNVKGMVKNHKLASAISDVGWGTFVNFLAYKLEREGKVLVEIDRWFPSSKTCSKCHYQIGELTLDVRHWNCPNCGKHHDRDENAAINIRAEGIRMLQLQTSGTGVSEARRGCKTTSRAQARVGAIPRARQKPALWTRGASGSSQQSSRAKGEVFLVCVSVVASATKDAFRAD